MHFTHCKYCELNHCSVCNVFAIHTYPLCLQQRILYCNYFEIRARRNAMSTTLQDCFSCWSSVPWWDCYMSSLEANKILLTTWELGELLVGNNLLIRFSLFLFLQFVCKHLFFSPSVLFTDWNDSLIFRAFTAISLQAAICDSQESDLIGHICHLVSFLVSECLSCDYIYDATVHIYKLKVQLLWIFSGSQLKSFVSPQVSALLLVSLNTEKRADVHLQLFNHDILVILLLSASAGLPHWSLVTEYKPGSESDRSYVIHCLALPLPCLALLTTFSVLWTCNEQLSGAALFINLLNSFGETWYSENLHSALQSKWQTCRFPKTHILLCCSLVCCAEYIWIY